MTAYTTPDALPYPDDYSAPADGPATIQALAAAVQAALNGHADAARQILAGSGLTGGGSLAADRTINVGAGTGISVSADAVAVDTNVIATRAYADGKVTNALGSSTSVAPSQAAVNSGLASKAPAAHEHDGVGGVGGVVAANVWAASDYNIPGASIYYDVPGMAYTVSGPCTVQVHQQLSIDSVIQQSGVVNLYGRLIWSGSQNGDVNSRMRPGAIFDSGSNQEWQLCASVVLNLTAGQTVTFKSQVYVSNTSSGDWHVTQSFSKMTVFGVKW